MVKLSTLSILYATSGAAASASDAPPVAPDAMQLETDMHEHVSADDSPLKRQRTLGGLPMLHGEDVNDILAALSAGRGQQKHQEIDFDWGKTYFGTKSGKELDKQKVFEGRRREIDNMRRHGGFRAHTS